MINANLLVLSRVKNVGIGFPRKVRLQLLRNRNLFQISFADSRFLIFFTNLWLLRRVDNARSINWTCQVSSANLLHLLMVLVWKASLRSWFLT